jgi:hypothetical protein
VTIVAGPQGGYHIFAAARWVKPPEDGAPDVEARAAAVLAETEEFLGPGLTWSGSPPANGPFYEVAGLLALVADPEAARDQPVVLRVLVEDEGDLVAYCERTVVAR